MAGGLGALETIGKKTMDILSEGDPGEVTSPATQHLSLVAMVTGLRKKRELLSGKPMTLSEVSLLADLMFQCISCSYHVQQQSLVRVSLTDLASCA